MYRSEASAAEAESRPAAAGPRRGRVMGADTGAELILQDCQKQLDRARRGGNWFSRGGDTLNHGTFHAQLAPYHDRVYYEGRVAWAALVMANPRLYLLGDVDSTGTVVYSYDKDFDAEP